MVNALPRNSFCNLFVCGQHFTPENQELNFHHLFFWRSDLRFTPENQFVNFRHLFIFFGVPVYALTRKIKNLISAI
jgi:hypothetical protein